MHELEPPLAFTMIKGDHNYKIKISQEKFAAMVHAIAANINCNVILN